MFTTQDWEWFIYTTYISGEIRDGLWHMALLYQHSWISKRKNISSKSRGKKARANPLATLMVVLLWLLIKIYVI